MQAIYRGPPGLPGWPVGSEMQLAVVQGQTPFPVALTYFTCWCSATGRVGLEELRLHRRRPGRARLWRGHSRRAPDRPRRVLRPWRQAADEPWLDRRADPGEQHAALLRRADADARPQQAAASTACSWSPAWITAAAAKAPASSIRSARSTSGRPPARRRTDRRDASDGGRRSSGRSRRPAARADVASAMSIPAVRRIQWLGRPEGGEQLHLHRAERRPASEADAGGALGRRPRGLARRLRAGRRAVHGGRHRRQLLAPGRGAAGGAAGRRDHRQPRRWMPREAARQRDRRSRRARWSSASAPARS